MLGRVAVAIVCKIILHDSGVARCGIACEDYLEPVALLKLVSIGISIEYGVHGVGTIGDIQAAHLRTLRSSWNADGAFAEGHSVCAAVVAAAHHIVVLVGKAIKLGGCRIAECKSLPTIP